MFTKKTSKEEEKVQKYITDKWRYRESGCSWVDRKMSLTIFGHLSYDVGYFRGARRLGV